jgi:cyclohexanone monooxygenase
VKPETRVDAVVIGAGFAGLYMLHRLRQLGLSTLVVEAGGDLGGTWYWNRYPGARCDVESLAYSYSFDPQLEQEWEWVERYPAQAEVLRYLNHVADRYDLRRDIRFDTRATAATFDESRSRWSVSTERGEVISATYLISAVGCLSRRKDVDIAGAEQFAGALFHTANWPREEPDFSQARVAVIGTGSTGIQLIPVIAERAAHLTIFQRTANYSIPVRNRALSPEEVRAFKAQYRGFREACRTSGLGLAIHPPGGSALDATAEERRDTYEQAWNAGVGVGFVALYADLLTNRAANETAAEFVRQTIRDRVKTAELAEALVPTDHPYGAKRPCLDTNYYETFNRDDVRLVDLRKTPIVEITARGVRTSEALHEVDAIIFATGFDAMVGALNDIEIRGRAGLLLKEKWSAGPRSYLGLGAAGFPNLFIITGPGSPSVLSNMVVSIEQHVDWIADCIGHLREAGIAAIEPTLEAEDRWVDHVNQVADMTLMAATASWYTGANVSGKPLAFLPYAGGVGPYRAICDTVVRNGYEGFDLIAASTLTQEP